MFWPLGTPFVITLGSLLAITIIAVAAGPWFGARRGRVVVWSLVISALAFVPSCTAVLTTLNHYRFGEFQYRDFDSVDDFRVESYLPEAATDITVDKRATGFRAKFAISRETLDQWYDQVWNDFGENSAIPRTSFEAKREIDRDEFDSAFGDLRWAPPPDAVEYHGPLASNGAGFTIWYSPSEGVGYEQGWYW